MCGIAGIYNYGTNAPADPLLLSTMTDAVAHRGPDGSGAFIDGALGLGHRRLAILDPSPRGAQPMHSASRRTVISYNGEIYNFKELRSTLEARGRTFYSMSDTAVILEAWEEWGVEAVARLDGIFAFALWDTAERALYLTRDAFGVKPLYVRDDGHQILFASEPKAILSDPAFAREVDWDGLRGVLELGYAPTPFTCFRGLRQLEAGVVLRVAANGVSSSRGASIPSRRTIAIDESEALDSFDSALDRMVEMQMVSDVPLGAFLSGGLDSTRIVQGMTQVAGAKTQAFTVAFRTGSFDESRVAADTARRLGIDHIVDTVDFDLTATALAVSEIFDDPFADSSALAMQYLCRTASRHVKVVLSGDGADELLAGYATHGVAPVATALSGLPAIARRVMLAVASRLLPVLDHPYSLYQVSRRLLRAAGETEARRHASWRRYLFPETEGFILTSEARAALAGAADPIQAYADHYHAARTTDSAMRAGCIADAAFYLPNDMLTKVDRVSMAHSLEVRVPFLGRELVETISSLPDHLLRSGGRGKKILRASLNRRLPWFGTSAPKQGFLVPIAGAFRGGLGNLLRDVLSSTWSRDAGIFDVAHLSQLLDNHRMRRTDASFELYTALMVLLWWKRFFVR